MLYERIEPSEYLQPFVKEYWVIEDENTVSESIKIIPDGYPEIIFHYCDPYRINLSGNWEIQEKALFAGQISQHFFLENTGATGMVGIKLLPTAPYRLANKSMDDYTDVVVLINQIFGTSFDELVNHLQKEMSPADRAKLVGNYLTDWVSSRSIPDEKIVDRAVQLIQENNGMIKMKEIAETIDVSQRHLERTFKTVVGLTPKYFSRIIHFNFIFEIMKEGNDSWIQIALDSGYFDQSHFIKEFKAFTGEEPTTYGFDEQTIANFFLKKEK